MHTRRFMRSRQRPVARQVTWWWLSLVGLAWIGGCQAPGTSQNIEGVKYYQQGQAQAAISSFQQALQQNPNNPEAYYNLASAYHSAGKQRSDRAMLQQAEDLYNRCLDLNPNDVACHRGLAVLLVDTDRAQSAFTLLERWANRSPQLADPRIELARLHEEFDETDTAQRYLAEAIDVDPTNSRAWAAMARLREQSGQYAQALTNYQQAQYLNPSQPGVAQRIAALQQQVRVATLPPSTSATAASSAAYGAPTWNGAAPGGAPAGTSTTGNQQGWTKR